MLEETETENTIGFFVTVLSLVAFHLWGVVSWAPLGYAYVSIYLLLKALSSKLLTPPSADKKIRVQLKDCALMTLFYWSFSSQSELFFFY